MPHLNQTGPQGKGPKTGRKLGSCNDSHEEKLSKLGKGLGKRRKQGGGTGKGKRRLSGKIAND
ncbi:MAG: DUF5320 domain-containing protein [Bacteroidales bacterium]|nr:DUF5320 domain-containing protein [Bacteroidales bacterium]